MAAMPALFRPAMTPLRRALVWASLSLTLAGGAQALTLTRPQVQSRLGEPLQAEIDFSEISALELRDLQSRLGSAETYRVLRLQEPGVPLQIELLQRPNGRPYLRLSSTQALQQKSFDVLLQLQWASGRLLRDFSITLDDPATPSAAAAALQPPPQAGGGAAATAAPAPAPVPADNASRAAPRLSVKPGDTASALVAPLRPASVSLDQMLLALLRQNPDAFVDQNVHRLKAGSLLQMPSAEQALATPAAEAREEVLLQTEDFNAYRAELATWAGRGELADAQRDGSGSVPARVQAPARDTKDQLTLTRPQDARAQEQLARQQQAREVAQRAAELGRNVSELGRLAAEVASGSGDGPNLPAAQPAAPWLDNWSSHPLTPVAAGSLIALMVLTGLWRQRRSLAAAALPPLNIDFDLDLPDLPPQAQPAQSDSAPRSRPPAQAVARAHAEPLASPPPRPALGIPDISLDLSPSSPHPLEVRLQLAQELWDLGQHHTSRALAEEIVAEAQGELQERARQWLAQRG